MASSIEEPTKMVPAEGSSNETAVEKSAPVSSSWMKIVCYVVGVLLCLFVFLVGLSLMGNAFKVLGGRGASSMFHAVDNPVSGLMTGVLATVLVQSSSTSTSIVVAMVGEGALTVKSAIPVIMGANIGTSVTNTIVALGQVGTPIHLERAFSGATVHDMFNVLTVATLLPLESISAAIQGEGGPLYWMTKSITQALMGGEGGEPLFSSPLKLATKPIVDRILKANKHVIYALTLEKPVPLTPTNVSQDLCLPLTRRLSDEDWGSSTADQNSLSRHLSDKEDCSHFFCISSDLDKKFEKISSSSYEKLIECHNFVLDGDGAPCGDRKCYLNAGQYYEDKVEKGQLIKGGFLQGAGDIVGGIVGLALSLVFLCGGLIGLCKMLEGLFMHNAKKVLRYATKLNPFVAMLIGIGITIVVQSSSVTTSALTPLCGLGILPLEQMLPLTLGANVGTCVTAMIASLVSLKFGAVQIALCHLCFNVFGILIWFPIPAMRQVPLGAARLLGLYAAHFNWIPAAYLAFAFFLVPGVSLGISAVFGISVAGGVILLMVVLMAIAAFEVAWIIGIPKGNALCYKVLSKEARVQGKRDLEQANAEILGETDSPQV